MTDLLAFTFEDDFGDFTKKFASKKEALAWLEEINEDRREDNAILLVEEV